MINLFKRHKSMIVLSVGLFIIIGGLWWQRELIKQHDGLVMAIVTTILVATTMYYSWLNRCLLENTNLPKMVLYIRPWSKYVQQHIFFIENVGTGIAFDIKLEVLDNQPFMLNSDLSLMDASCAEISSMPPNKDYKILIKSEKWTVEKRKTRYKIKVRYTNSQRKEFSEVFSLSIEETRDYLQDDLVAEFLREIAVHAKGIANQSPDTQTTDGSTPNIDAQIEEEKLKEQEIKTPSQPST